jgi:hypothetical protein
MDAAAAVIDWLCALKSCSCLPMAASVSATNRQFALQE